jgi:hypothetical protein
MSSQAPRGANPARGFVLGWMAVVETSDTAPLETELRRLEAAVLPGRSPRAVAGPPVSELVERALSLIVTRLPISADAVQSTLAARHLIDGRVDLARLARAAGRLGRRSPFLVVDLGGTRLLLRGRDRGLARLTLAIAGQLAEPSGLIHVADLLERLREQRDEAARPHFVRRLLRALPGFEALDESENCFRQLLSPRRRRTPKPGSASGKR